MANSSPASVVRFGIIGCASIAEKISRAIHTAPNAELIAVGSRSVEKARRFAAYHAPWVSAYGSYMEVLDDPRVDAVYVPLPTSLHVEWAVKAAAKGKHVLLEKPTALCAADLDRILAACEANRVQFMDGTMWMHHPRTAVMEELLRDPARFGDLKWVHSSLTVPFGGDFFENNVRVKPDLDALGALGDLGWYCIRGILWGTSFELPETVVATRGAVANPAGVLLSCGASLHWPDGRLATFHCSFLSYFSMELFLVGTRGSLHIRDFVTPYGDISELPAAKGSASFAAGHEFKPPQEKIVETEVPQEVHMVAEFARLVGRIRGGAAATTERKWGEMSRKTQLVLDAVKKSIDNGYVPVEVGK